LENENKTNQKKNIIAYFLMAISVVVIYLSNHFAYFEMDDLWYATNLVTGQPLKSISDVWESQVWHFLNWGGRSIAHGQLQLILMCGEKFADILNTVVTACIVYLICRHAKATKPFSYLMALGFLVVLNANWYQTLMWESGASNYLYMTSWMLLFMLFYANRLGKTQKKDEDEVTLRHDSNPLLAIPMLLLGVICGWSNENMGPTIFLGTLSVIILIWKKEKKLISWMIAGNIGTLLGSCFCILAPGNFVRVEDAANTNSDKGLLWRIFLRCYSTVNGLLYYLIVPLIVLAILLFVYCIILNKKLETIYWIYCAMGIVSWGAMILSPHYPDRASFGSMVFLMIPSVKILAELFQTSSKSKKWGNVVCVLIWLGGMLPPCVYICQGLGWVK